MPEKRRYFDPLGESLGGKSQAWQSGGAVVLRRRSKRLMWCVLAGALCTAAIVTAPVAARAQGFFDFLFGGPQRPPPPPSYPPPPPEIGRIAPAPLGQERVNENAGTTGHGVAFCVRLCDGQHFPLERMANATPAETCKTICPTSATKVYFGSEIEGAVAGDGARYSDLNTAFLYRKHLVANCTCNGKDPFGLATFDVKTDPTLRPGDIISTKDGLMTFSGRSGQSAFTPVAPSTLGPQLNSVSSRQKPTSSPPADQPPQEVEDEPGTIVHPQNGQPASPPPQNAAPNVAPRAPAGR
jgi:hypothetical protein